MYRPPMALRRPTYHMLYDLCDVQPVADTVRGLFDRQKRAGLRPVISFDTETTGLHLFRDRIILFSLYVPSLRVPSFNDNRTSGEVAFAIAGPLYNEDGEANLQAFRFALEDPDVIKVGANIALYDQFLLANHGITLRGPLHDITVMDWLYDENRKGRHGLKVMSRDYLGYAMQEFTKAGGGSLDIRTWPLLAQRDYPCDDVFIAYCVYSVLRTRLERENFQIGTAWQMYEDFFVRVQHALYLMIRNGVCVDMGHLDKTAPLILAEADALLRRLTSRFALLQHQTGKRYKANETPLLSDQTVVLPGDLFNPNSTQQIRFLFEELLETGTLKRTKPGKVTGVQSSSFDSEVLEELASRGVEEASDILAYRGLTKLYGTYIGDKPDDGEVVVGTRHKATRGLRGKVDPHTHKIHASFRLGPVTGRLSSSSPNLQNLRWEVFKSLELLEPPKDRLTTAQVAKPYANVQKQTV